MALKSYSYNFMTELVNHLKAQGFVFQGSEIYGGLANTWDYGPYGTILKNEIATAWKNYFINPNQNSFLIDTKILMNPQVWVTSGHVGNFSDWLVEDKMTKKRYRADHLLEKFTDLKNVEALDQAQMFELLKANVAVIDGKKVDWDEPKQFNLLFETAQGVVVDQKNKIYLRPETAQGIFINFKNIQRTMRASLPMAIGQIGKAFRNEITPGNFIFRTREFEQMELEVFCNPDDSMSLYKQYIDKSKDFILSLGINPDNLIVREHEESELAHYSKGTSDLEFNFPWGWGELMGIAHRGDYDLSAHAKASKVDFNYLDPATNQKYVPHVIEPSVGLDRLMLALLCDAFKQEELAAEGQPSDIRSVLSLPFKLAPVQVAILPLVKKQSELASELMSQLPTDLRVTFDQSGSIGKRYRRADALGVKYCLTVDYDSENDNSFTVRDRDTMEQKRMKLDEFLALVNVK